MEINENKQIILNSSSSQPSNPSNPSNNSNNLNDNSDLKDFSILMENFEKANQINRKKKYEARRKSWQKEITRRSTMAMSVFGKAPTLEMMRKMNQKSGNNESLFRGAEFWYKFRLYYFYFAPLGFIIGLITAVAGWNTIEGHMIIGGLLSLISGITVVASYLMIIPWRKHPSTMVLYRSVSNIFFSLSVILMAIDYHIDDQASCGGYPEFFHFFLLAGEGWLTTIALDLYFSLTNPFTSYKLNMRRYHLLVWFFSTIITFTLYNQPSCQARVQGGLCWLRITAITDSCLWGYYFFWMICMYGFQFGALLFAYHRLKKGLPITFEIRKKCAIETFQCLGFFASYLILLSIFFIILLSSQSVEYANNPEWITFGHIFLYFVSCRGYVDSLVWFKQHDFARDNTAIIETSKSHDQENDEIENDDNIVDKDDINKHESNSHFESYMGITSVDIEGNDNVQNDQGNTHPNNQILPIEDNFSFLDSLEQINKGHAANGVEGIKLLDAMNDLGESAVMSFDEADLSPQVNMALRQQIVKYVTMGVSKATSGNYHPDNRHSVNPIEDALTWTSHAIRDVFIRKDPVISELKVTQFMLDDEHPFKEFAPDMFAELRKLEGISPRQYLAALEKTEKEQLSEGASGAFMFFCGGMDYIVKTINPEEANVLHRSLRHYLAYLKQYPNSLLVRFLGSYSLGVYAQTFHFVVMRNIFEPGIDINERFDIKGSWVNRSAHPSPPNKQIICRHCNEMFIPVEKTKCSKIVGLHEGNVVLKDNDFRTKISLQTHDAEEVLKIVKRDSDLLAALGVMDYSLIVGIKKQTFDIANDELPKESPTNELLSSVFMEKSSHNSEEFPIKKRYASWKAKSVSGPAIYYMGIVDFLQEWNSRKRIERALKIYFQRNDPLGVSVMKPSPYRDRFQRKMEQIFDFDDPLGLFNDRGSVSIRKNYYLGTSDGKPILSEPIYEELSRDNNQDSVEGDGTIVNALHRLSSSSSASYTSPPTPSRSQSNTSLPSPYLQHHITKQLQSPQFQQQQQKQIQKQHEQEFQDEINLRTDEFNLSNEIKNEVLTTVDISDSGK